MIVFESIIIVQRVKVRLKVTAIGELKLEINDKVNISR